MSYDAARARVGVDVQRHSTDVRILGVCKS